MTQQEAERFFADAGLHKAARTVEEVSQFVDQASGRVDSLLVALSRWKADHSDLACRDTGVLVVLAEKLVPAAKELLALKSELALLGQVRQS